MKVALVYDRVNKWGGAERVLLALHEIFPTAPLYTSVYNPSTAPWASVFDVRTSFLNGFPFASSFHEYYALLMPLAFEQFSFDEYDFVISVTSEAAKGILTKPKTLHLCYCLTPTRYLWSGYEFYFQNPFFRFVAAPIVSYLRAWDRIAAQRPDVYIAISKEVQGRIKKYYDRASFVVYPPVSLAGPVSLHPRPTSSVDKLPAGARRGSPALATRQHYFLIVSRLVPYKRIDIAVRAFNLLKLPLVIVGSGSELSSLRSIAGHTITFVENLTEGELVRYYTNCRALIFPGHEDLGLVAIEAQACGRPVIAYRAGGALETVVEDETGLFFAPQTAPALAEAVKKFCTMQFSKETCMALAIRFAKERFQSQFRAVVGKLLKERYCV